MFVSTSYFPILSSSFTTQTGTSYGTIISKEVHTYVYEWYINFLSLSGLGICIDWISSLYWFYWYSVIYEWVKIHIQQKIDRKLVKSLQLSKVVIPFQIIFCILSGNNQKNFHVWQKKTKSI